MLRSLLTEEIYVSNGGCRQVAKDSSGTDAVLTVRLK